MTSCRFVLDVQKAMEDGAPAPRDIPTTSSSTPTGRRATISPPFRSRALSRSRAGTTRLPCSTATSRTTAASPMRRTAASSWCPPPRSPYHPPRGGTGPGPSLGGYSDHQALHRRRLRQQAGRLYEPLCAWCTTQVGGRCVRIDCSREETFVSNRVRHAIPLPHHHLAAPGWLYCRPQGGVFLQPGRLRLHGHSIVAKAMGSLPQIYPCDNMELDASPCSPTSPPPAPCGATVCLRPPLPMMPTSTSAPVRYTWIRWSTA